MTGQATFHRTLRCVIGFLQIAFPYSCLSDVINNRVHCGALRDKHFVVAAIEQAPYIEVLSRNKSGYGDFRGYSHEVLKFLADICNFTFEYTEPEPSDYVMGAVVNGNWTGLVGMLLRDKADIASSGLAITQSRSMVIDFTTGIQIDPVSLLIPYPKKESSTSGMLRPFRIEVWISLIASILTCSYAISLFDKTEASWKEMRFNRVPIGRKKEDIRKPGGFFYHFMFLLSSLVNPGNRLPNFGPASTAIVAVWCLAAVVISNSYITSVKSYLTAPRYLPLIKSLDDLATSMSSRFLVEKYNSIWYDLMTETSGTYGRIGIALRQHPENALTSLDHMEDAVALHDRVFAQRKTLHLRKIYDDFRKTGRCRLYIAEKNINVALSSYGLKKHSYLTEFFSYEILWMHQYGFASFLSVHYLWPRKTRCSEPITTKPTTETEKLSLSYLSSAFILLTVGVSLSMLIFLVELAIFRLKFPRQLM